MPLSIAIIINLSKKKMSIFEHRRHDNTSATLRQKATACLLAALMLLPPALPAQSRPAYEQPDSAAIASLPDSINIPMPDPTDAGLEVVEKEISTADGSPVVIESDTIPVVMAPREGITEFNVWQPRSTTFNPDPTRAVWMSALFPGLGQIYNRRFWKLPIVVGAYVGLGYGCSWNNSMLSEYTRAYRDIMDNDPSTKSYMDIFPSTTREEDLDKTWLTNVLRTRKDYYRRNRDLCVIAMIGVYLIAMVDAYVDASLSHFDITPDLAVDVAPAVLQDGRSTLPSIGLSWALTF